MKNILITVLWLLLAFIPSFSAASSPEPISADGYFDWYWSSISWEDEMNRLDNFAISLSQNPEYIGYIAFESKKGASLSQARSRVRRSIRYITQRLRVERKRIVAIHIGESDNPRIILQPVEKGLKSPFNSAKD